MRGYSIDMDGMHRFLWRRADHTGRLRIQQRQFAEELGIAHETVCRLLKRMADQGRIKKIAAKAHNVGVYSVKNPDEWAQT